jgi:hypothetical protein
VNTIYIKWFVHFFLLLKTLSCCSADCVFPNNTCSEKLF